MQHSWEVLRQYGNMSSATIFYVLQRMMHQREKGTIFAAAFGPGLTVESAHMEL
jgi:predicted naringenin-chalcone synthase